MYSTWTRYNAFIELAIPVKQYRQIVQIILFCQPDGDVRVHGLL